MAKTFGSEKNKWAVKISIEKKKAQTSKSPGKLNVVFRTEDTDGNNTKKIWYEELKKFIVESKKEVNLQADSMIATAKKWQRKTNEQFDMIEQFIMQNHNPKMPLANDKPLKRVHSMLKRKVEPSSKVKEKQVAKSQSKQKAKPKSIPVAKPQQKHVCFPSMPVLLTDADTEDDLNSFLLKPPVEPVKKIVKRRNTVCTASNTSLESSNDSKRKHSRKVYSSVAAIEQVKSTSKSNDKSESSSLSDSLKISKNTPPTKTKNHVVFPIVELSRCTGITQNQESYDFLSSDGSTSTPNRQSLSPKSIETKKSTTTSNSNGQVSSAKASSGSKSSPSLSKRKLLSPVPLSVISKDSPNLEDSPTPLTSMEQSIIPDVIEHEKPGVKTSNSSGSKNQSKQSGNDNVLKRFLQIREIALAQHREEARLKQKQEKEQEQGQNDLCTNKNNATA